MGSGDPYGRQLDGMGAGISSLSKICLVEPYGKRALDNERAHRVKTEDSNTSATGTSHEAERAELARQGADELEVDIDYTFVGLGIENLEVDVAGNCGNMSSAIGPYAYNAGLLPSRIYDQGDGPVTVKIRNTNTGKLIDSTFDTLGGQAAVVGDYKIDGVGGSGSKIKLDFKHPYGSKTGKVLPTGKRVDTILGYKVTCVDGPNPAVFIRADDIGVDGTILPNDFTKLTDKLDILERVRKTAAVAMGIAPTEEEVPRTIPKIGLVSQSSTHAVLSGDTLKSTQMDIVIRFISDTQPHRAIPLTAALTTAVAARIPGTIVEQLLAPDPVMEDAITIGHASGRLQVNATMDEQNPGIPLSATVYRTAKRLFEGDIFWTDHASEPIDPKASYGTNGRHSLGLAFVLENRGQDSLQLYESDIYQVENAQQPTIQLSEDRPSPTVNYRPLAATNNPELDSNTPTPRPTVLTTTMTHLHTLLGSMLSDPAFAARPYTPQFLKTVRAAYASILADSDAPVQSAKGKEWHAWAKQIHKRTERTRKAALRAATAQERAKKDMPRTTKREVGLDKFGRLVKKEKWDAPRLKRKERAMTDVEQASG